MEMTQTVAALLTPVIAVITTYIAIEQHRINRLKVRLDLFDKRYAIYQGVKKFILFVCHKGNASDLALSTFNEETQDAFFVCGRRVERYIDELRSKAARLMYLEKEIERTPAEPVGARTDLTSEAADLRIWFGHQLGESKTVFRRYLGL
jgi:hypothetical protein